MVEEDGGSLDWCGPPVASLGALRQHRHEARAVVDHQVATLNEFDDAALRTTRIAALALALVLSASRWSDTGTFQNPFILVGCGGLVSTFGFGLLTHGSSNVNLGPSPERVRDLRTRPYSEREWLLSLLEEYANWIRANQRVIYRHSLYLQVTQTTLLLSVVLLGVGVLESLSASTFLLP